MALAWWHHVAMTYRPAGSRRAMPPTYVPGDPTRPSGRVPADGGHSSRPVSSLERPGRGQRYDRVSRPCRSSQRTAAEVVQRATVRKSAHAAAAGRVQLPVSASSGVAHSPRVKRR